jgi:hypothetical protein
VFEGSWWGELGVGVCILGCAVGRLGRLAFARMRESEGGGGVRVCMHWSKEILLLFSLTYAQHRFTGANPVT